MENNIYTLDTFRKEVMGADAPKMLKLLKYKKNLILQGAPGVGKTYSAKRLCYTVMGCRDDSRITQVQFHASYTYEDFIKGMKPTENGGFRLEEGPFYIACKRAEADPKHAHFIIIDEINRGNISSILGEAFSMIEKGHRGEKIMLKYNAEEFSVPANLFIIGTMNTADRGLTVLDYALRRRFSFYTVPPAYDSPEFKQMMQKHNNKYLQRVLKKIRELNKEISEDELLGPGFMIGHSYFCSDTLITNEVLEEIIEYELIPLIEEYWFDDIDNKAEKWKELLRNAMRDNVM